MSKMLVLDLDNTLLKSDKTMSSFTIQTLQTCQAHGVKIAFATARSCKSSARILSLFMPDIFIGYGGALVVSGGETIHRADICADVSAALIQDCLAMPDISHIYAVNENTALTNDKKTMAAQDYTHYQYHDFARPPAQHFLKISIEAANPDVVYAIAGRYPMCDMARFTGENLYRFVNKNAVKWPAVQAVARHHGLNTGDFIAFGDDAIDLDMIKHCGTGVAMANAIDSVKAAADHICDSNDNDGVAKWLRQHLL
ncbi:MAG: HAD family hydrolase [Defluviitaleaceae bacterium]|nr:HAD family hydrolase [Defluviitaleaceae bacterium]